MAISAQQPAAADADAPLRTASGIAAQAKALVPGSKVHSFSPSRSARAFPMDVPSLTELQCLKCKHRYCPRSAVQTWACAVFSTHFDCHDSVRAEAVAL